MRITDIAKWIVETAARNTQSGNYIFSPSDIARQFNESEDDIVENYPVIIDEIFGEYSLDVLECTTWEEQGEWQLSITLGANICCEHCKGLANRSYEECGNCAVMMDLWED